jgi:predicted PurR-regulated permease PerM
MIKSDVEFNNRVRQLLVLILLLTLFVIFLNQLYFLAPGFLGAVTLYILSRENYCYLTFKKKWRKGLAAFLFLGAFTVCIGIPIYFSIYLLIPRVKIMLGNKEQMMQKVEAMSVKAKQVTGFEVLTPESSKAMVNRIGTMLPDILNSSALVVANFILILFLAYFMLINKESMEKSISNFIPLKDRNVELLGKETKNMVRANAIGIPLISLIQGSTALLGYWIFGVEDFVLWGFITAIFSFFPVIGTSLIWIPLVINHFVAHPGWQAIGLMLYSVVVIANVDYLARISILKRIGQVHPVVTIIGVVLGLKLFGFWGFIFGPLLISYLILLLKIYTNEFGHMEPDNNNNVKITEKPTNTITES